LKQRSAAAEAAAVSGLVPEREEKLPLPNLLPFSII
jgi:hypothetical protein